MGGYDLNCLLSSRQLEACLDMEARFSNLLLFITRALFMDYYVVQAVDIHVARTLGLSRAIIFYDAHPGSVSLTWQRSGGVQCAKVRPILLPLAWPSLKH